LASDRLTTYSGQADWTRNGAKAKETDGRRVGKIDLKEAQFVALKARKFSHPIRKGTAQVKWGALR